MKIILLIILFFIHYFLSIKTYKKYQGKKLLFLYLKWTVGACILAVLTSVMVNCFPTMDNRELYIMSTGTIVIISLSNLMILVLTTVFPYTLSLMKKLALKNGVQLPENYDEKINKKQTLLFNYLKIMQLVMCTVAILAIMFLWRIAQTPCAIFYQWKYYFLFGLMLNFHARESITYRGMLLFQDSVRPCELIT